MLNLPHSMLTALEGKNTILVLGVSGGLDIFAGMPLYYSLTKFGKKIHLANITHTDFKTINEFADPIILAPGLYGANFKIKTPSTNYVEGYLSQFFKASANQDVVVWMFERTTVPMMKKACERLIEHLKLDAIILVDGGVDSIMTGKEDGVTHNFVDNVLILKIFQEMPELNGKVFSVACYDNTIDISKNLSLLSLQGGFYGGCYLLSFMKSYQILKMAYNYIKNNNDVLSVDRIIKITESDFEDDEEKISPMQYLFFNTEALIYNNIVIPQMLEDMSYYDIVQIIAPIIKHRNSEGQI
jgi:hypothetical protein